MRIGFAFFLILLFSFEGFTQSREENFYYKHELKWQAFSLTYGSMNVHYETYNQKGKSINAFAYVFDYAYSHNIKGFGLGIGYRNYFTPEKKHSFYLEPFGKYQFMREYFENVRYNTNSLGIVFGRKWVFSQRLTAELYLGPCYNFGLYKEGNNSQAKYPEWFGPVNGIWARFGFTFGYRFN